MPSTAKPIFARWMTRTTYGLLTLFILLSCIITALTGTPYGSRWLINSLLKKNPTLHVQNIDGSILHGLHLKNLHYHSENIALHITKASIKWQPLGLAGGQITLTSLYAEKVVWTQSPSDDNSPPTDLEQTLKTLPRLPLALSIRRAALQNLKIKINDIDYDIQNVDLSIKLDANSLNIKKFSMQSKPLNITAIGQLDTNIPYAINADLQWDYTDQNEAKYSGELNIGGNLKLIEIQHKLQQPFIVNTSGNIELLNRQFVKLNNKLSSIEWRDQKDRVLLNIQQAQIELEGWLENYTVNATTLFDYATVSNATLQLTGKGNAEKFNLNEFIIDSPKQKINGIGTADITLSPSFALSTNTKISLADNNISLNGTIDRNIDIKWQLEAPTLKKIWPELSGSITSQGSIKGSKDTPVFNGFIRAHNIDYNDYKIGHLTSSAKNLSYKDGNAQLTANNLAIKGQYIDALNTSIKGMPTKHHIKTTLQHRIGQLQLDLKGTYSQSQWQGQLTAAQFSSSSTGLWQLAESTSIQISKTTAAIGNHCWHYKKTQLCSEMEFNSAAGIELNSTLTELPLNIFKPYLYNQTTLDAPLNGSIIIKGPLDSFIANIQLEVPKGSMSIKDDDDPTEYTWSDALLTAEGQYNGPWTLATSVDLLEDGHLNGKLNIDAKQTLDGRITAKTATIGWLAPLIPQLNNLQGQLSAEVDISGTIKQPLPEIKATLAQGSARVPSLGITLSDVSISVDSEQNNRVRLHISAQSGEGRLQATGKLTNSLNSAWQLLLKTEGKNFQLIDLPQIQLTANPDLALTLNRQQLDIEGAIKIPTADVNIKTLPAGAIDVSPDTVEKQHKTINHNKTPFLITSRIQLQLGDNIQFQGFGFSSALSGDLSIREKAGQATQAFGELYLLNGRYKAYGQDLTVEENSRLIFQGPYDNPALSIRAVRKITDATVGLELNGTLKKPQSRLFSIPPLPETEIAAILVTGKPLSSASQTDANAIVNAIAAWGLERSSGISQRLSETFKLDTIRIESQENLNESSLLLGKYLTPRLFIHYAIGLFEQTNNIGLEYQLNKNLKLEAESGVQSSIDLIYKIER